MFWARWWLTFGNDEWQNKKEELEYNKLDTEEKKPEKDEKMCSNYNQQKNEVLDKEKEVAGPFLIYAYGRRGTVQASNLFSQLTSRHQVMVCTLNIASNIYLFISFFYLRICIYMQSNIDLFHRLWCINPTGAFEGTTERYSNLSSYFYSRWDPCFLKNTS